MGRKRVQRSLKYIEGKGGRDVGLVWFYDTSTIVGY